MICVIDFFLDKSNRSSNAAIGTVEQLESDEETELNQTHSDDDDFRKNFHQNLTFND